MHSKLLTFEDLVMFCEQQNFTRFSSKESGYQICVQVPAQFSKTESEDPTMFYGNVLVMHTGQNRNHSSLTEDAAKKAIKNLAYKPVLANFCEIDGVRDFTSHDFDVDENGDYVYYEKQVGCFTAEKAYMEQDPDREDRMNVFAKVAIPREYTDAAEIIERKNGTKVSVELAVNELSYNSKDKLLILEDVDVMGLTLLGVDPDTGEVVQEGMQGAHIQIEDFSKENNSLIFNAKIINEIADVVIKQLSNINNQGKEDERVMDFEEKIEETTVEETEVETTEEETVTEEMSEESATEDAPEVVEETEEKTEEFEEEVSESDESDGEESRVEESEETEESEDSEEENDEFSISYSVVYGENRKEFSVSLQDKIYALSTLVNDTYSETDNAWYEVTVYDDEKFVIMKDWWNDKAYKQSYKVKKDVYSLVGDRVQVYAQYLTEDEIKKLDDMRSNYSSISEKLEKYEAEPEKMKILNSDEYANIAHTADFVALKSEENHFDMSVDEVRAKADELLLAFAKGNKIEFETSESEKKNVGVKKFANNSKKKTGRYGSLFKK